MLPPALQSLQRWKLDLGHSAWSLWELIKHNSKLYIYRSLFDDSNRIEVNPTFQVLPQDLFELCSRSTSTAGMNWALQVREKCLLNLQLQTWTAGRDGKTEWFAEGYTWKLWQGTVNIIISSFSLLTNSLPPSLFSDESWEYQYRNKYKWHVGIGWNSAKHLTAGEVAKNKEQKSFRFTSPNANSTYLSFHLKIN